VLCANRELCTALLTYIGQSLLDQLAELGPIHRGKGYFHNLFGVKVLGLGVVVVLQIVGYVLTATMPNGKQALLKGKALSDVKVGLVMSRHTILLKDNSTFVVPTVDIAQLKSALPLP
jgi:hypothetical protein